MSDVSAAKIYWVGCRYSLCAVMPDVVRVSKPTAIAAWNRRAPQEGE